MKRILISAQSRLLAGIDRQYTTATISDMLFEKGALPFTAHFSTHITTIEEGLLAAERYMYAFRPDGIVLQGGEDVPMHFYTEAHEHQSATMRDYFELGLIQVALQKGIPLFGICRGMQLLNVALGGTLIEHLDEQTYAPHVLLKDPALGMVLENSEMHTHAVDLLPGGVLDQWYQTTQIEVTSFHHQAVRDIAPHLVIEAVSPDGVVEAFSYEEKKILGVQWHPEIPQNSTLDHKVLYGWLDWL